MALCGGGAALSGEKLAPYVGHFTAGFIFQV